ncbi:hypothetical protein [Candidatus Magnetaquicoccus inordinatus]|uniref:hypothetical protein n=1 Tax=Candidatus Magnetaquicoccus inordinatus TaxID=2496818 RepID=UPI00187D18B2|nr:hypothetical protein [Candidatus Magnetaquicoccus inordinatus]
MLINAIGRRMGESMQKKEEIMQMVTFVKYQKVSCQDGKKWEKKCKGVHFSVDLFGEV